MDKILSQMQGKRSYSSVWLHGMVWRGMALILGMDKWELVGEGRGAMLQGWGGF